MSAGWTLEFLRNDVRRCYVGERLVDCVQVKHEHKHVHNHDDLADILKRCLENRVDCVELAVELGAAARCYPS